MNSSKIKKELSTKIEKANSDIDEAYKKYVEIKKEASEIIREAKEKASKMIKDAESEINKHLSEK